MRLPLPDPLFKHTTFYSWQSTGTVIKGKIKAAGWSESFFALENKAVGSPAPFVQLQNARLAMMPRGVRQVGWRVVNMKQPNAPLKVSDVNFANTWDIASDTPALSAVVRGRSTLGNILQLDLRAMPDFYSQEGIFAFTGTDAYTPKLDAFLATLTNFGQVVRDLNPGTSPVQDIVSISDAGVVTLVGAFPSGVAQANVQILRSLADGRRRGVLTKVSVGVVGNVLTIANWPWGPSTGGKIRLANLVFTNYIPANMVFSAVSSRKVGKPPFVFVGRRSSRV